MDTLYKYLELIFSGSLEITPVPDSLITLNPNITIG